MAIGDHWTEWKKYVFTFKPLPMITICCYFTELTEVYSNEFELHFSCSSLSRSQCVCDFVFFLFFVLDTVVVHLLKIEHILVFYFFFFVAAFVVVLVIAKLLVVYLIHCTYTILNNFQFYFIRCRFFFLSIMNKKNNLHFMYGTIHETK